MSKESNKVSNRVNKEILLKRAEEKFLKGDFQNSLRSYGLILKDYPKIDEARVGAILSDLGFESPEEAQALFDYYISIKDEKSNPVELVKGLVDSLDSTKQSISQLLEGTMQEHAIYNDGIHYEDFLKLIESRGSFKKAFEDIMFSTKVVITDKDEFIDFVTQLSKGGFDEMALGYLDATTSLFGNDQDILALYNVVRGANQ